MGSPRGCPMSYFTRAQIEAELPPADLVALLDDDHDGTEDTGLFTALAARAEARCNAILQRRYALADLAADTPLAVAEAAILSLCASLYRRRGTKDAENPFAKREADAIEYLKDAAAGEADLSAANGGSASYIHGEDTLSADDLHFDLGNQEGI